MDQPARKVEELRFSSADLIAQHAASNSANPSRDLAWASLRSVDINRARLAQANVVAVNRRDPAHASFDMMRTSALQTLRRNKWTSIAITSPTELCGKTTVALNLAFSLSHQLDCRTAVIDLNLKNPQFETRFGIAAPFSIENYLSGACPMDRAFVRFGDNLAIGTSHQPLEYSAELLQSLETARALQEMQAELAPDIVIYDMPAMLGLDDVTAFLPNVDCALLVAAAGESTFEHIDRCERYLVERTNLLGVVLNRCRHEAT